MTTPQRPGPLGNRMARGALWSSLGTIGDNAISVVNNLVLARLLTTDDFGLIALGVSAVGIVESLSSLGSTQYLVRLKTEDRESYDTAFTLNVLRGLFVALVMCAAAVPIASFLDEAPLAHLCIALSLGSLIGGFANTGFIRHQRALNFRQMVTQTLTARLLGMAAAIATALLTRSYWAVAVGSLVQTSMLVVLSYALHRFRPHFGLARYRDMFGFSAWLLADNLLASAVNQGDRFIMRKFRGLTELGQYSLAGDIGGTISGRVVMAVGRVLYPAFTSINREAGDLGRGYFLGTTAVFVIVMPLNVGLALVAHDVTLGLLGQKWLPIVPYLVGISLVRILRMSWTGADSLITTLGRVDLFSRRSVFDLIMRIGLGFYFIPRFGVAGAILSLAGGDLAATIFTHIAIRPTLGQYHQKLFSTTARHLIAAGIMSAVVLGLQRLRQPSTDSLSAVIGLAADVPVGALSYFVAVIGLWRVFGRPDCGEARLFALLAERVPLLRPLLGVRPE